MDQDRYDYEVRRQLWEEEQEWLVDPKSQQEWILFLEILNERIPKTQQGT